MANSKPVLVFSLELCDDRSGWAGMSTIECFIMWDGQSGTDGHKVGSLFNPVDFCEPDDFSCFRSVWETRAKQMGIRLIIPDGLKPYFKKG